MKLLHIMSDLAAIASSGSNVIIEAVPEVLDIKRQVFTSTFDTLKANAVPPEDVLICSNTISIPVENIILGLDEVYSCRCVGARFLYPVLFVDDVVLTTHSRNTIGLIHTITLKLRTLQLKPTVRGSLRWRFCRRFGP